MNFEQLSLRAAAAAIRNGELSAEVYAQALLARCEAARSLNVFLHIDPERVLAAARAADSSRQAGAALKPLHGLPIVLKDNLDTADVPTTAGTPGLARNRPRRN